MIENRRTPSILEAHIVYLFTGLLLISLGAYAQSQNLYKGLLITEYLIVLMPALLLLKFKNYSFKRNLRLNKITLKQAIITMLIVIFSYPVGVFLNSIGITILSQFGELNQNLLPFPSTLGEFLVSFLIIALTPGICEEVMFRGVIMSSYNKLGKKKAIIYSAIVFSLFHFNGQNLLGPAYLGLLFGLITYKTNSLYTAIIGHTTNNTIALIIGFWTRKLGENLGDPVVTMPSTAELMAGVLVLGIGALIFGSISYKLIKILPESNDYEEENISKYRQGSVNLRFIEVIPIIIIILLFIFWNYRFLYFK